MRPVAMACPACGVEVRGAFRSSFFGALDAEEQQFLEDYLLADFSIKDLAASSDMGYAAIRSRLDRLIAHYRALKSGEDRKKKVLAMVAEGKITAQEAAKRIAAIDRGE
jgi:hypothetical protein